jgi:hypothetical protein
MKLHRNPNGAPVPQGDNPHDEIERRKARRMVRPADCLDSSVLKVPVEINGKEMK